MMSTRALGLGSALRKAALNPNLVRNQVAMRNIAGKRFIQVESLRPAQNIEILNSQRLKRPSSPHFTIYQPQLTWLLSIVHRGTGIALGGLFYGFSIAYLIAPTTFDTAHIVEVVAGLPEGVKYAGKALLAAPFAFHSFNGVRHLSWDLLKLLSLKGVYRSGYTVLGASAVATAYLTFFQ
ncbi:succinate dehydrogenase cytochrome b560 subunit [Crepidotus variabilis]|uniref:Succinate dehydrogenase cytochrome b560 subunit n=1 Tax=Crepidotus variabilis TaxID=179855 RepID=A0A9P6EAJ1_9AGAR|nr:succinate dehydrogenase cytochrome b560 subunit [Crepidotus variabilis]